MAAALRCLSASRFLEKVQFFPEEKELFTHEQLMTEETAIWFGLGNREKKYSQRKNTAMKVSEISLHKAPPELKQTRHARHIYLSK